MDPTNPTLIGTRTKKIDITLEKNTKLISQNISKFLSKGDIIYLIGEVGVGKTTFVRFLINYLQEKSNLKLTEIPFWQCKGLKRQLSSFSFLEPRSIQECEPERESASGVKLRLAGT